MIDTSTCETFDEALDRVCESMEGRDVIDELVDVQDLICELAKKGRADKIGEVIQAVFDAYVERVTASEFYGHPLATRKTAQEAAAAVMAK